MHGAGYISAFYVDLQSKVLDSTLLVGCSYCSSYLSRRMQTSKEEQDRYIITIVKLNELAYVFIILVAVARTARTRNCFLIF